MHFDSYQADIFRIMGVNMNKLGRKLDKKFLSHLQGTIDHSPACVIIAEAPTGEIIYINEAVKKFRGETKTPLNGINIEEYMKTWKEYSKDGILLSGEEMPLGRALVFGEIVEDEEIIVELDDGSKKWALASAAPVYDDEKNIIAGTVIWYDITERKKLENQKDNLISDLQKAVNEIKTLRGIIPICSYCNSIRDDEGAWSGLMKYMSTHTEAKFSHGICPTCIPQVYAEAGLKYNK
jgi:PAS domain S-box-containing protein